MKHNLHSKILALLEELATVHRTSFQRQIKKIWLTLDPFEQPFNGRSIEQSQIAMEECAAEMVSDAAARSLAVSKSPEAFAIFQQAAAKYLSDIEGDLVNRSSREAGLGSAQIFDDSKLKEIRRRVELQIDTYRAVFTHTEDDQQGSVEAKKRGPKDRYDWFEATHAIWGQIFHGKLIPQCQEDIEQAFLAYFTRNGKVVGESTVKPFASPIWRETEHVFADDN